MQLIIKVIHISVVKQRPAVQQTIEIPQLLPYQVVDVLVWQVVRVPQVPVVEETVLISQALLAEKIVAFHAWRVPQGQAVTFTVEIPQLQFVENIPVCPDVQTVLVTQTSDSLGTARLVVDMPVGVPTCGSSSTG